MLSQGLDNANDNFRIHFSQVLIKIHAIGDLRVNDRFQLTSLERFCPLPFLMAIRAYKRGKTCGHRA